MNGLSVPSTAIRVRLTLGLAATAALLFVPTMVLADIPAGADYFATVQGEKTPSGCIGTWVDIPSFSFGVIPLKGVPGIVPGTNTDTIVQRKADAKTNGESVPIEIVALHLQSVESLNLAGGFFVLDLQRSAVQSDGEIFIGAELFNSTLPVAVDITLVPVHGGQPIPMGSHQVVLKGTNLPWSHHAIADVFHSDHFCPLCLHGQPSDGTELGMLAAHGIVPAIFTP